jgi:flagellar hook-length control protein FliK
MLFAVGSQQQLASLKLNPPQLGPLEIHLQLDNGQVNAQFVSPHQAVRQALESAMPQLHDMFNNAGMSLAQASVNSGGGRGERNLFQRQSKSSAGAIGAAGAVDEAAGAAPALHVRSANGLVNTYV